MMSKCLGEEAGIIYINYIIYITLNPFFPLHTVILLVFCIFLQAEGIAVSYQVYLCESRWKSLWLGVLFGYKVIIQGIGVFLAFKIRKVKVSFKPTAHFYKLVGTVNVLPSSTCLVSLVALLTKSPSLPTWKALYKIILLRAYLQLLEFSPPPPPPPPIPPFSLHF